MAHLTVRSPESSLFGRGSAPECYQTLSAERQTESYDHGDWGHPSRRAIKMLQSFLSRFLDLRSILYNAIFGTNRNWIVQSRHPGDLTDRNLAPVAVWIRQDLICKKQFQSWENFSSIDSNNIRRVRKYYKSQTYPNFCVNLMSHQRETVLAIKTLA